MPSYDVVEGISVGDEFHDAGSTIELDVETASPFLADGKLVLSQPTSYEAGLGAAPEVSEPKQETPVEAEATPEHEPEASEPTPTTDAAPEVVEEPAKESGWVGGHKV